MARPTLYKADYPYLFKLLLEGGYTQEKIAAALRIGTSTVSDWKRAHPEFAAVFGVMECDPEDGVDTLAEGGFRTSKVEGNSNAPRPRSRWAGPFEEVLAHVRLEPRKPRPKQAIM